MDVDDLPIDASAFFAEMTPLCPGELRFAEHDKPWNSDNLVQVLAVRLVGKQYEINVTDGATCTTVFYSGAQICAKSIVQLPGLMTHGGRFVSGEPTVVLDASTATIPIINVEAFPILVAPAPKPAPAPTSALDAFRAHLAKRAHPDAEASDAKVARQEPKNPLTQFTSISIALINETSEHFVIGPVVIVEMVPSRLTDKGSKTPTKLRVSDAYGDEIWYTTFDDLAEVEMLLCDWRSSCFWLGNGAPKPAWGRERVHPCEIDFQLPTSRAPSEKKVLTLRAGTAEDFQHITQSLRALGKPTPWDTINAMKTVAPMSVIEVIDAKLAPNRISGGKMMGILDSVTERAGKSCSYLQVAMAGRRAGVKNTERLTFNLFSSLALAQGQLMKIIGALPYDRQLAGRDIYVQVSGITITPGKQWPMDLARECTIEEVNVTDDERAIAGVPAAAPLVVMTLSELLHAPPATIATVYILVAHCTEERPLTTRFGTSPYRGVSYMDDSKDTHGLYSVGSFRAFRNNAVTTAMLSVGTPVASAYSSDSPSGTHLRITDPTQVLVVKVVNATTKVTEGPGTARLYVCFDRESKFLVIPASEDATDEHARRLRAFYAATGHINFVEASALPRDYNEHESSYSSMYEERPSASSSLSSSSSAAARNSDLWDMTGIF